MRIGDTAQVHQACGLLAQVVAVQQPNAAAGVCFTRISLTGERALLTVEHPTRAPLHLDVDYDISRQTLRALLRAQGLRASPEPAEHDSNPRIPRPDDPGPLRHGYVLLELCDTGAWTDYHQGRAWQGQMTDIVYATSSTNLIFHFDDVPWRATVKIFTGQPDNLIGLAYNVVDNVTNLMEDPSAEQREQMSCGEVTLTNGYSMNKA